MDMKMFEMANRARPREIRVSKRANEKFNNMKDLLKGMRDRIESVEKREREPLGEMPIVVSPGMFSARR